MKYTNNHNLPLELVKALSKDRYIKDVEGRSTDYSVTSLIAPVQQTILRKRYPDLETGDIIDNLWSMFGSIAHTLLEEHGSDEAITEQRFYTTILGKTISGQVDHIKEKTITDYKTTSVYKVKNGDCNEWTQQLNAYAYLCKQNGVQVDSIRIIAILRDWSATEALRGNSYPNAPIKTIDIPLWPEHKQAIFLADKVTLLKQNETRNDIDLIECTNEEMWASEDTFACIKVGNKKATKVFNNLEEAETFCLDKKDSNVVKRLGERKRCNKYCNVASRCSQYAKYKSQGEQSGEIESEASLF